MTSRFLLSEQDYANLYEKYKAFVASSLGSLPDEQQLVAAFQRQLAEEYKGIGNHLFSKKSSPRLAIEMYQAATELCQNPAYFTNMAAAYTDVYEFDNCMKACKAALALDPNFSKAYLRMGRQYSINKQYDEAIQALERALELDPKDNAAANILAQCRKEKAALEAKPTPAIQDQEHVKKLLLIQSI